MLPPFSYLASDIHVSSCSIICYLTRLFCFPLFSLSHSLLPLASSFSFFHSPYSRNSPQVPISLCLDIFLSVRLFFLTLSVPLTVSRASIFLSYYHCFLGRVYAHFLHYFIHLFLLVVYFSSLFFSLI